MTKFQYIIRVKTQSDKNIDNYQKIVAKTDEIYTSLVKIRRDLHSHPEISKQASK